MYVLTAVNIL